MCLKPIMNPREWRIRLAAMVLLAVFPMSLMAEWKSPYYQDHPLVGQIWDARANEWISEDKLFQRLSRTKTILLGEVHTNLDHHILQAKYIQRLQVEGQQTAVVMEMLPWQEWKYKPRYWSETETLLSAVKANASNWPWDLYYPVLDTVAKKRVALFGAGLSRSEVAAISKKDDDQLKRGSESISIVSSVNASQRRFLTREVVDAHCGYLDESHASPLVNVQIARDLSFAWVMHDISRFGRVFLIAGSGHVGKQNAVPIHLERRGVESKSLTFVPVRDGQTALSDYLPDLDARGFDYAVFTPSNINQSPCEAFKDQLEKLMRSKDS